MLALDCPFSGLAPTHDMAQPKSTTLTAEIALRRVLENPESSNADILEATRNLIAIRKMPKRTRFRRKRIETMPTGGVNSVLGSK